MTETLKQWAALDPTGLVVHGGFDAPQSYIDNYQTLVVDPVHVTTPPWYDPATTKFVDVTGVTPRPVEGCKLNADRTWTYPPLRPKE